MKPTQVTELFANIRKTFVSFFSILMFVALGVGIFLGISWAGPALQTAADNVYDEGSYHHFQIQYLYGLTDDDMAKLASVEGVTDVEGARQSLQTLALDGTDYTVKVQTMGERINMPIVLEGTLPTKPDEIALNAPDVKSLGIGIGDTVTFKKDGDAKDDKSSGMKYLNSAAYKVTALVNSPEYLALSASTHGSSGSGAGTVHIVAWVPAAAFNASAFRDAYPIVNVRCNNLASLGAFTDAYSQTSATIEGLITELGEQLAKARFDDLHDQAQKQVDEGQKQLDDGKKKIADGEKQLADGYAQLESQRAEGEAKLANAYEQLMGYENMRRDAESKLTNARKLVNAVKAALTEVDQAIEHVKSRLAYYKSQGEAERKKYEQSAQTPEDKAAYDAALDRLGAEAKEDLSPYAKRAGVEIPEVTHENYFEKIEDAYEIIDRFENTTVEYEGKTYTVHDLRALLAEGEKKLADAEAEFASKSAQLDDGWSQYYAGQAEFNAKVAEAEQKLADGEAKLEQAKKQVAENEPKLEDAKKKLGEMKPYDWNVAKRSYNASTAQASLLSNVMGNLSYSMAALFIIVGLLVSYSAVSRIVHEQITQIGTKKALGLRGREITMSFLAYSALAVVAGSIIGAGVGIFAVERIIGHTVGSMFILGDYPPYCDLLLFLGVTALEVVLVLGATWLACHTILKKHAVELLQGEKPPEGKTRFYEKWTAWDKLPLLTQTIVNNCMNDKRRVFSTIVGVAGCTALIVTALTLNNDVLKSYDRQYENVYGFDYVAFVDSSAKDATVDAQKALEDVVPDTTQVRRQTLILELPDGSRNSIRAIIPEDEGEFADVYHVNPVTEGSFSLQEDGVWVSQAYAAHNGANVGDEIVVDTGDGVKRRLTILGFYEYWLTSYEMVLNSNTYADVFETEYKPNALLVNSGDAGKSAIEKALESVKGSALVSNDKANAKSNFDTFARVSRTVVIIYLVLSILMAIVVLLNLNVMFIQEKKRELIVLMINGFSVHDAKRYIYNDTIALTLVGIVVGLVLGCAMGAITVGAVEPSMAVFLKEVDPIAVAAGVIGSALLSFLMSFIALRSIPRFSLTDINKF